MIFIKQITTVEELWKTGGAPTGQIAVDAVVDYVKRVKTHSAQDVAFYLNVDQRFLNEAMKLFVGVSLKEFIMQWRMRQALDLLDDESLSFKEVALRCGFRREKNLIAAIHTRFGTTPYAYRNGTVLRNGNYQFNQEKHQRKIIIENAEKLRSRNEKPAPNGE
ncbi:MAG: helix-turn-helix transcriptional regulator [Bacteroidales bacterium]|nr:helix-turn-helix transcriptional regulator [Bacteroidales bacterium]